MSVDVLVLDGETRPALAVVRSLGGHGLNVAVASDDRLAIAGKSRYSKQFISLPSPRRSGPGKVAGVEYIEAVIATLKRVQPKMILPLTDLSCRLILKHRHEIPSEIVVPTVDEKTFLSVANKAELLMRAEEIGISIPQTLSISNASIQNETIRSALFNFPFPAVIKPQSSEQEVEGEYQKGGIHYLSSADQVVEFLSHEKNTALNFLLQQQIVGPGVGVFALCHEGETLATFCHRRILEKPPSGGRSVLSESLLEGDAPVQAAQALLRSLRWNGVAMVEFKKSADEQFYLMEINPRFWGSLQLAIDSGRDFPYLLYLLTLHGLSKIPPLPDYQLGRRLRWDLGCLDHVLIRLKQEGSQALRDIFLRNSLQFLRAPRRTSHETWRLTDPLPFVYECGSYVRDLFA